MQAWCGGADPLSASIVRSMDAPPMRPNSPTSTRKRRFV